LFTLADCRVIGIAKDYLAFEVMAIMAKLILNRGKLGIEFVSLPCP